MGVISAVPLDIGTGTFVVFHCVEQSDGATNGVVTVSGAVVVAGKAAMTSEDTSNLGEHSWLRLRTSY